MNARDNIKPKSIRVAILQALADGAITTIDDLQIKMDEKREKIINNIYPEAADGLIKRMRDDVTKQAAYQITAKGRELLAKYASGKVEAPADVVDPASIIHQSRIVTTEMREIPAPEVSRRKSESVAVEVLETAMPEFTAAVVAEKDAEIARIRGEMRGLRHRPAGEMREMLRAMQYGEMTVSRGIELLEMWLAGNYSDDQLPPVETYIDDEDLPTTALIRTVAERDTAWNELRQIRFEIKANDEESTLDEVKRLAYQLSIADEYKIPEPVGYALQRPLKPLLRFTKANSAENRAMAFARAGQRAQVFALHLVGTAVPGAEWRKA